MERRLRYSNFRLGAVRAFLIFGIALTARSEELLTGFRTSAVTSSHGKVSEIEFVSPPVELDRACLLTTFLRR